MAGGGYQAVCSTCGAAGALNVVLKALLDPGDEVLVLAPYFPEYLFYADNHGGTAQVVETDADFQLDLRRLEQALFDRLTIEELEGLALAHPDLVKVHFEPNYVYRADAPVKGKVALISGGGSGHEPMHGGFVGMGMLDAACPGAVFTSPTPDQMLEATKAVNGGCGVLHIVKNYTGDIMNFEMSAELARAEGIEVEAVVTDETSVTILESPQSEILGIPFFKRIFWGLRSR